MHGTLLSSFFQTGGPFVWPLIGCLVLLVALESERIWTYWRMRGDTDIRRFLDRVGALAAEHGISRDLQTYCRSVGRLEGHVLSECLSCYRQLDLCGGAKSSGRQELERVAAGAAYKYLHRPLSVIISLAQAATLLGLLGTFFGVLRALGAVSRGGVIETASANAGLTEALLATVLGLIVAASAIWVYIRCDRRADRKMTEFVPVQTTIAEILIRAGNRVM